MAEAVSDPSAGATEDFTAPKSRLEAHSEQALGPAAELPRRSPKPTKAKRGRKLLRTNSSVERGLVRLFNCTDAPFEKIARAVELANGPGQWVRKRFQEITGTRQLNDLRIGKLTKYANQRKREQLAAQELAEAADTETSHHSMVEPTTSFVHAVNHSNEEFATSIGTVSLRQDEPRVDRLRKLEQDELPYRDDDLNIVGQQTTPSRRYRGTCFTSASTPTLAAKGNSSPPTSREDLDTPVKGKLAAQGARKFNIDPVSGGEEMHDARPMPCIGQKSQISWLTKKRTADRDSISEMEARPGKYGKMQRLAEMLRTSSIGRHLDALTGETSRYYSHIARRLSNKTETITSRVSLTAPASTSSRASTWRAPWQPYRTEGSEYKLNYHDPSRQQICVHSKPGDSVVELMSFDGLPAVTAIMLAKSCSLPDEEISSLFKDVLSSQGDEIERYVNQQDSRGVSALHLAVAYGLPQLCATLMEHKANSRATTNQGTTVSLFAKPAEKLASDIGLYHRIMLCRQWVGCGVPPPNPDQTAPIDRSGKGNTTPLRTLTMSTISALDSEAGTSMEDAADYPLQETTTSQDPAFPGLTSGPPGVVVFEDGHNRQTAITSHSTHLPPAAYLARSSSPNVSSVVDFALPMSRPLDYRFERGYMTAGDPIQDTAQDMWNWICNPQWSNTGLLSTSQQAPIPISGVNEQAYAGSQGVDTEFFRDTTNIDSNLTQAESDRAALQSFFEMCSHGQPRNY
ncbi:hypothetical protein LTR37_007159 [Vermiconidia calcicola]|uniref:Uncharacterized protein n=1 Tax=Vermiconidia calcicola TaxID=1690605 RepID=A0ACC3NEC0_9PEZI|nr:hypothetical protein LTR37_007159 [Vermiconidia calcicola]